MKRALEEFQKEKDFLICIDSDGCVLDTMDVKHMRCFGPCLVYEWDLSEYRDEIIRLWRRINLLSMTRGINRFKGLAKVLAEIHENYINVEGLDEYIYWVQTTNELSDESLREAFERTGSLCIKKALDWSRIVNQSMEMVSDNKKQPFSGAREALKLADEHADVAIVSSANGTELQKEWKNHEIFQYADLFLSQETGSKRKCLEALVKKGYKKDHIIMIGDAPIDLEAAKKAGVLFYPILPYQERESWEYFEEALKHFLEGTYAGEFQDAKIKDFEGNLSKF